MPYFLSNSITDAMTTEEQSVSGIKPIFTSFFSGASEPAAQAALLTAAGTRLMMPDAPARLRKSRRLADFLRAILRSFISLSVRENKRAFHRGIPANERPRSRRDRRWPQLAQFLRNRCASVAAPRASRIETAT